MSETLPSFTERHMPTYSRWFSRPFFQAIWRNLTRTYKHVLAEADLPAPVKETIRVTVKKTRLWHREMRDVAAELITHFQDGLDAGKTSDELVKSFGDARQAAKLIRKAKRRCRPLWWQAWWYVECALGLFVCWYIIAGIWQYSGRPTIKTDYLAVINQKAKALPVGQRAWPIYREALREIDLKHIGAWYSSHDFDMPIAYFSNLPEWPEIEQWLDSTEDGRLTRQGLDFADSVMKPMMGSKRDRKMNPTIENQIMENRVLKTILLPTFNTLSASRKEMNERYNDLLEYEMKQFDRPYWEKEKDVPDFVKEHRSGIVPIPYRYWLVRMVTPAYSATRTASERYLGRREGTIIGIALELYHREYEAWPRSLEELSPKYVPTLPIDRINGTPLLYKIVNDRPVVYSKGRDGFDDGGAPPLQNRFDIEQAKTDGKSVEKQFEYWRDYSVSTPNDKPSTALNEENGDWIIWTTLPEHRRKKTVEESAE